MDSDHSQYSWPPPPRSRWERAGRFVQRNLETILTLFVACVLLGVALIWWFNPGNGPNDEAVSPDHHAQLDSPQGFYAGGEQSNPGRAGSLSVFSYPNGATVFLGSTEVGTAPLELDSLAPGTYQLTFQAEGFFSVDTTATIAPGELTSLIVFQDSLDSGSLSGISERNTQELSRSTSGNQSSQPSSGPATQQASSGTNEAEQTGTLAVVVRPWGTIQIDGSVFARETDVRQTIALPFGEHQVRAIHPFLGTREMTVTVRPGATTNLEIDFN